MYTYIYICICIYIHSLFDIFDVCVTALACVYRSWYNTPTGHSFETQKLLTKRACALSSYALTSVAPKS